MTYCCVNIQDQVRQLKSKVARGSNETKIYKVNYNHRLHRQVRFEIDNRTRETPWGISGRLISLIAATAQRTRLGESAHMDTVD